MSTDTNQSPNFQLLRRRYQQSCAADEAKRYADPEEVKQGNVSFERNLPFAEYMRLRRLGLRFDDE